VHHHSNDAKVTVNGNPDKIPRGCRELQRPSFLFHNRVTPGLWIHSVITGDLNRTQFGVLMVVHGYIMDGKQCVLTNGSIAVYLDCIPTFVSRTLRQLQDKNLLKIEWRNGVRHLITPLSKEIVNERADCTGSARGGCTGSATITEEEDKEEKKTLPTDRVLRSVVGLKIHREQGSNMIPPPFHDEPSSSNEKDNYCHLAASKLYTAVRSKFPEHLHRPRLSIWTLQISRLERRLNGDRRRLSAVLDWVIAHMGEEFAPDVFCPRTLAAKFAQVERRMSKDPKEARPADVVRTEAVVNGKKVIRLRMRRSS
jgi:hypothetical protein